LHTKILAKNSFGNFGEMSTSRDQLSDRSYEICMEIPRESGKGVIRKITFQCGIALAVLDYKVSTPFISKSENKESLFGFRFSLSGKTRMNLPCLKNGLNIEEGQSEAFYFPEKTGACEDRPGDHIIRVSLQLEPPLFHGLMEKELPAMPTGLRTPAEKGCGDLFDAVDIITPPMQSVLGQIIHCPYRQGTVRQLFLEGKALELMAYKLEQLTSKKNNPNECFSLKPEEMDRIQAAGEILKKQFQNPPGLYELSYVVGLSRSKLLNTFKTVYGTSPAGFIRDLRLQKARQLLETGKMNVTEAAYFVGYSSLSHFALVFRQYYGTSPGRLYPKKQV